MIGVALTIRLISQSLSYSLKKNAFIFSTCSLKDRTNDMYQISCLIYYISLGYYYENTNLVIMIHIIDLQNKRIVRETLAMPTNALLVDRSVCLPKACTC